MKEYVLFRRHEISYFASYAKYLIRKLRRSVRATGEYDLVFVVFSNSQGWILEAICREIARYFPGTYCFHHSPSSLPAARAYYFAHYSFLPACLKQNPHIWGAKLLAFYTHPRHDLGFSNDEYVYAFNKCTKVICMCSDHKKLLVSQGVRPDKVTYIIGGADADVFTPHDRADGAVGFSQRFTARKSPDLVLKIVKLLPHRKFILLGRRWEMYERYQELRALPNLSYAEPVYAAYPQYYAQMDVFVSASKVEGGPIPLIETMMCNIFPVASRTGFAPDVIVHGVNGFLFEVDDSPETICDLIEKAFRTKQDVHHTVEHLTWKNFSYRVQQLLA